MNELTKPEHACERHLAKRKRDKVKKKGGCFCCVHCVRAFGIAACTQLGKTFPSCIDSPGLHFEPDHNAIAGVK